jgi:ceramide synthetase
MASSITAALDLLPEALIPRFSGEQSDLIFCLYLGVVILAFRIISEAALTPLIAAHLTASDAKLPESQRPSVSSSKRARKVFDNAFTSISSGIVTGWAWVVMLNHNGGCTPMHPDTCLKGWPKYPVSMQFRYMWLTLMGFYTYEMIGTAIRKGCILGTDMVIHHFITGVMMLYGYFGGLHRFGLMATALFDISNPVLHAAKTFHYMETPASKPLQDIFFKLFALVFAVARVFLPPFGLIYPGLTDGRVLPRTTYYITNALMLSVYSMQLFWFSKIVNIALGGDEAMKAETSKEREAGVKKQA